MDKPEGEWRDFVENLAIRALLGVALRMPYERRVRAFGWIVSRVVAPFAGWDRRISENLAYVCPDLPRAEVRRLKRAVPDNAGRMLIESYSGEEFLNRTRDLPLTGPGVAAFEAARAEGRPVVLVTAHLGNYYAARGALASKGHDMAVLYRPMKNAQFNDHYVRAMNEIGEPNLPADRRGVLNFVRHLSRGGIAGILLDVYAVGGAPIRFFGKRAPTALSAAEWAIRYDALVVPIYALRKPDGLSFEIVMDAPIKTASPRRMTQALTDSLERQVRTHMDQWFWIHRRWENKRRRADADVPDAGEEPGDSGVQRT